MLDYLWAALPIVATQGDSFAELIEFAGAGLSVPPGIRTRLSRLYQDQGRSGTVSGSIKAPCRPFYLE